ncbi:MAG: hypothetical protein U5N56_10930 [Candidatus Marinimicrobia bacterium]|nr:hypothetical protein [Candidatus Neomarinimicrobiota bacterium]
MLKEILLALSLKNEDLFFSFSAQLAYFSFYDNVDKENIEEIIDKDIWLTTLKLGSDYTEGSECQVKVVHRADRKLSLICIYYPKAILEIIKKACSDLSCRPAGLGINIFNLSEIARHSSSVTEYFIAVIHRKVYEVMNIADDSVLGYARFSYINGSIIYYARNGDVPDAFCKALVEKNSEFLNNYVVYLSCSSEQLESVSELSGQKDNIHILNPMNIGSPNYSKPSVTYEKKYNTVFSSALGALM